MPPNSAKALKITTRRQLALLLVAAMACVATILASLVPKHPVDTSQLEIRHILLAGIVVVAAFLAGLAIWHVTNAARRQATSARAESQRLRRNLASADAVIKSEPQILLFWEQEQAVRVVAHTLTTVAGVPERHADVLRFGQWLQPDSSQTLKDSLHELFISGHAFNIILQTRERAAIEAEGRAAGGRAVLRLKDVSGFKLELSRIDEQHVALARDVRSSRALLNTLPMPVWLRASNGRLIWVNAAYVQAVDAKSELEVLDSQIELLESRQRKSVRRSLEHGQSYKSRVHLVARGERKPHDVVVLPVDGMSAGAAIDVTDLETAQGELARQIAAYDRTLHRVETAVGIFNREQQLVFHNEAFEKLWSLDVEWLATRPSDGAILDRLREIGVLQPVVSHRDWKAQVQACYRTGAPLDDTWHLTDGRIVHVMAEQRPDGGVTYLFADKTEHIALEGRYNALIDVQSETLNTLKEGVAVFGTDGRLKLFNRSFCSIWNIPDRRLLEYPHVGEIIAAAQILHEDGDTWMRIRRAITSFSDERSTFGGQMKRADGLVIDYALMPLPDGASLLTFSDVTDAKRAERALLERNEALEAADRLKTNFIGHISYELRSPLTNIIGFTELLASSIVGDLNPKQREYVTDIMSSSKTLLSIIDDILDLATIDAGSMELSPASVGVRTTIDAAIVGISERAERARLTIEIAVADDVTEIMADESRLRQILYNLLSNAVGFSRTNGLIKLACWRENATIIFTVTDQGVGIPKNELTRVFQRFESRSRGSDHRGAGLGLSIVKKLVELHGGSVEIQSEVGVGTRVTVRIPERPVTPSAPLIGLAGRHDAA